jgi:malonyl-CoA/methylmalonyl-CoA synthetase
VSTHANIAAQIDALVEAWEWSPDDRILHVLPLHHVHGLVNVLLCALGAGAVCEFAHPFEAERVWDRISSGELTLFMAVPTIYAKLVSAFDDAAPETRQRWSDGARAMRLHVCGSAALPVPVLERWESITGQRLLERYGMTEIGMALSNPYRGERRAGFVGRPLPGVDVRRADESGGIVADHEQGEIEVRGPSVFQEYWNRPEETAASFRDGWFRTGDIAVVDDGDYRILGRSSVDIIKTGGYKVSALEIEDVLRTHADIRDCAVVGVADDEWGERVAVCVVCDAPVELDALRQWGKQRLASYKLPSLLRTSQELPRNTMGKVQKRRVRQLFEEVDRAQTGGT